MRYKIRQVEVVEYVLEADNVDEVNEFIQCHTSRELRAVYPDLDTIYSAEILEKTVMPANFRYSDNIPMIPDEWPDYYQKSYLPDEDDPDIPFN
ncbi:hypothetical protein SAMN02910413_0321 [Pseudobutyrivibrio sp. C4]|uniref:hypothetical protein n=1 Tax=Pseudobutyrivibrio sp. C4 TaxID=1520803 RepID=UPI0008B60772|nr:hypothetical protein [Pseudobutyrivibrio sp. C4]SES65771.1 hypothetical protein SAMN02910413_0321 [Pseudobutyrivibrio sp. C4]